LTLHLPSLPFTIPWRKCFVHLTNRHVYPVTLLSETGFQTPFPVFLPFGHSPFPNVPSGFLLRVPLPCIFFRFFILRFFPQFLKDFFSSAPPLVICCRGTYQLSRFLWVSLFCCSHPPPHFFWPVPLCQPFYLSPLGFNLSTPRRFFALPSSLPAAGPTALFFPNGSLEAPPPNTRWDLRACSTPF